MWKMNTGARVLEINSLERLRGSLLAKAVLAWSGLPLTGTNPQLISMNPAGLVNWRNGDFSDSIALTLKPFQTPNNCFDEGSE